MRTALMRPRIRIVTVLAAQCTALQEHDRADTRSINQAHALDRMNISCNHFGHAPFSAFILPFRYTLFNMRKKSKSRLQYIYSCPKFPLLRNRFFVPQKRIQKKPTPRPKLPRRSANNDHTPCGSSTSVSHMICIHLIIYPSFRQCIHLLKKQQNNSAVFG